MGAIREALDMAKKCENGKCKEKKNLKEWVTPACSVNWKELKDLAAVEDWAKEVEEKTGKEPKWCLTHNYFDKDARQRYFDHYSDGGKVFIGGTSGLYGMDDTYYLGTAEKGKDGKLQLVFAFDAENKPVYTALVHKEDLPNFDEPKDIKEDFSNDDSDALWNYLNEIVRNHIEDLGYMVEEEDEDLVAEITDDAYEEVMASLDDIVEDILRVRIDDFEMNIEGAGEEDFFKDDFGMGPWGK